MAHERIRGIAERPKEGRKTILRLIEYLVGNRLLLIVIVLLVVLNIALGLIGSYLMRPIINDYIIPGNLKGLSTMLFLLLGIYLSSVIVTNIEYRLMNVIGQKTALRIRTELFGKMQSLPIHFFDSRQYGNLMSLYTNDMDRVSDALTDNLADFITAILTLVGIIGFMLYISPLLTLVAVATIPLMIYAPMLIVKRSKHHFKAQQNALGELNGFIEEKISGQKVIKAFSTEKQVQQQFTEFNNELKEKALKAQLFSGMMMPTMQSLTTINLVLVTLIGAILAIFRGLDVGGLATFVQYTRQWGFPINQIATLYNNLQSAIAGAERIFEVIDQPAESADSSSAVEVAPNSGNIRFENVCFSYIPNKQVLSNISITIHRGQKVAIVGKTGAGKTTFMNMLPRFYDVQKGEIRIERKSIQDYQRHSLRKAQAIVLQDTHLFSDTVLENIRYGNPLATEEQVVEAAKLTAAHSFIKRLPYGYHTKLKQGENTLSQGQQQLISITRSAVANPHILLLDEATSNIDSRSEILIQKGLDKIMQGRTSIIIAHRISTIKNADKIIVIDNGEVVEEGTHLQLMAKKGEYFSLYENQFKE